MSSPTGGLIRHNLQIASALARSGVKGGLAPPLDSTLQPVAVMADLAQNYSGEVLQARGMAGKIGPLMPINSYAYMRLQARAPGGAVVEYLSAGVAGALSTFVFVDILDTPPTVRTFENAVTVVQSGGELANSPVFEGDTLDPPSGAGEMELTPSLGFDPLTRIYVPTGAHLVVFSGVQSLGGLQLEFRLQWREIPAPVGLP